MEASNCSAIAVRLAEESLVAARLSPNSPYILYTFPTQSLYARPHSSLYKPQFGLTRAFASKPGYHFAQGLAVGEVVCLMSESLRGERVLECYSVKAVGSYWQVEIGRNDVNFWHGTSSGTIIGILNGTTIHLWSQGRSMGEPIETVN